MKKIKYLILFISLFVIGLRLTNMSVHASDNTYKIYISDSLENDALFILNYDSNDYTSIQQIENIWNIVNPNTNKKVISYYVYLKSNVNDLVEIIEKDVVTAPIDASNDYLFVIKDEVDIASNSNKKIIYHFEDGITHEVFFDDWSSFDDFDLEDRVFLQGVFTDSNYQFNILENGLSSDFEEYKYGHNFINNELHLYVKSKKLKGIKYYYKNKLIKQDDTFSFESVLWNMDTITLDCENATLKMYCHDLFIKQDEIDTIDILKQSYLSKLDYINLGNEFYVEIDIVKVHDNSFYVGAETIYKNMNSMLSLNQIKYLIKENIVKDDCIETVEITEVDYIGNGNVEGVYKVKICFNDEIYETVNIEVLPNLRSDYIYGNNLYFHQNKLLSSFDVVNDMKYTGLLPYINLTTSFNAMNDFSNSYFSDEVQPGTYSFNIVYSATSGEAGEAVVNLKVSESPIITTEDKQDDKFNEIIAFVIVIVIILVLIYLLYILIFGKKRRYRRRR